MGGEIEGIVWDDGNLAKCQSHGVSIDEIEELLSSGTMMVFPDPSLAEERLRGIGKAKSGRHMFLVFTLRRSGNALWIRPISARYMHEKEVIHYEQQQAATKLQKR
jgi:uncharacterized DUF497 family protein